MKIKIPNPCHENWEAMTDTEKGKFCKICNREVINFSVLSDSQLLDVFEEHSSKVCGKFNNNQLNRNLHFSFVNLLFTKFAISAVLTVSGIQMLNAQQKTEETLHKKISKYSSEKQLKSDTAQTNLNGRIGAVATLKEGNEPLYYIDGKEVSPNRFRKINPDDIERIDVLKGESAIVIYGKRAKYGAVIVTTKHAPRFKNDTIQ